MKFGYPAEAPMTAQEHPFPRVGALMNTFADWLRHRRDLSEIRQLDTTEFNKIASLKRN
jgi:uncharacterized protein YjiS (DUF1127 family)